jgi:hypothetical protein
MMAWLQLDAFLLTLLVLSWVDDVLERRAARRWSAYCASRPPLVPTIWAREIMRYAEEEK